MDFICAAFAVTIIDPAYIVASFEKFALKAVPVADEFNVPCIHTGKNTGRTILRGPQPELQEGFNTIRSKG
ncbi:hypothetical protein AXF13_08105 [Desulfovibrio fairfieldensis]|uniref:Uncharacterized protein n=1 Tax=Desulfovibrio fairfieldensis TaxID=44742 RepID=A0A0X8JJS9_9BACT|nr:hypothetical protein AXF13_08105 [Desulfovibrio fairfieldensis]